MQRGLWRAVFEITSKFLKANGQGVVVENSKRDHVVHSQKTLQVGIYYMYTCIYCTYAHVQCKLNITFYARHSTSKAHALLTCFFFLVFGVVGVVFGQMWFCRAITLCKLRMHELALEELETFGK